MLATKNAFAVLKASKSKKDEKDNDDKKKRKDEKKKSVSTAALEAAIFSQPSMGISNWADEDDEDYAMPSLPADWAEVRSAPPAAPSAGARPSQRARARARACCVHPAHAPHALPLPAGGSCRRARGARGA